MRRLACLSRPLVAGVLCVLISAGTTLADPQPATPPDEAPVRETPFAAIKEVVAPGTPGYLAVWGERAFVVAVGKGSRDRLVPAIAAGELGAGRVVAFPHTGYLSQGQWSELETDQLVATSIRWVAPKSAKEQLRVGLFNCDLGASLIKDGFTTRPLSKHQLGPALRDQVDVVCLVGNDLGEKEVAALTSFIEAGGGVLAAQTAWAWKPRDGAGLVGNPLNVLFARSGIAWTGGYAGKTGSSGFLTQGAADAMLHASRALDACISGAPGTGKPDAPLAQAQFTVLEAIRVLPPGDSVLRPRLDKLMREHAVELSPSERTPLTAKHALQRLLLAAQLEDVRRRPPREVRPHGASSEFPGPVPATAPRVRRGVTISPDIADWQSTGLYAGPGEVVTASIPATAINRGIRLRIGCHTDHLWDLDSWKRVPQITTSTVLNAEKTEIASAFGGPIYFEAPRDPAAASINVSISGVVEAPLFVLGTTALADWTSTIRSRPAPWAELVGKRIIVSVPSTAVRSLDDPESLMKFWDSIAEAEDDLAAVANIERHHRQDRFVADVQISAGYMHSGYPIMTHLDAVSAMTDVDKLRKGQWGLVHELGHNHQNGDWTFDGTTEVTCNLFSMYAIDKACGLPWREGHGGLRDRDGKIGPYIAAGAKFDKWKSDPFLALQMYAQLVETFGWETFKRVFAEYRELSKDSRPKNDQDKRDQWMTRFSRACGKNLGPFFDAWGVPVTEAAKESIKDLPGWMPEGFPPK